MSKRIATSTDTLSLAADRQTDGRTSTSLKAPSTLMTVWYGAGLATANPAHGYCVPTPTQRAIPPGSVNSTMESWEVNGHTT